jgi:16S rRNA (cytidine1402-2'-O)-methyltransferase
MSGPRALGTLYVVATPIGNLGDMTARAVAVLLECDLVASEDTRRTRQLLTHFAVRGKPVSRLDAYASRAAISLLVERLLIGERIALVTDAGTPGVSDPGERLVTAALEAGVSVVAVPGASAVLAALAASGLSGDGRFRFVGFLPRDGAARRAAIAVVCETPETVVLFEAPQRVRETIAAVAQATPMRRACVARELTKVHEEWVRGTLRELAEDAREWIGEIAIVLGPYDPAERGDRVDDAALDREIESALAAGERPKTIAERLAAWSGRKRREIYSRVLSLRSTKQPKTEGV